MLRSPFLAVCLLLGVQAALSAQTPPNLDQLVERRGVRIGNPNGLEWEGARGREAVRG